METKEELDGPLEVFQTTHVKNGRVFGYVVGLLQVIGSPKCYAWVQKSYRTGNGEWKDWGARQRSRPFPTMEAARDWAYATAKYRAEKYLKGRTT